MKKKSLKHQSRLQIFLYRQHSPLLPSLESLLTGLPAMPCELFCLCGDKKEAKEAKNALQQSQKTKDSLTGKIFTNEDFSSVLTLANSVLMTDPEPPAWVFFLSSNIHPVNNSLAALLDFLAHENQAAGVNPVLETGWLQDNEKRIAFMGIAVDYQKQIHYLYEGILPSNNLVNKKRFFQLAHPGALLIRASDFIKCGGFKTALGYLAFPALCFKLADIRNYGFTCLRESRAGLQYQFDSWDFCGIWNSILQRGRLDAKSIKTDYARFCQKDKIDYSCDKWLAEGPEKIPDLSTDKRLGNWQNWLYHPNPTTLLTYLSSLTQPDLSAAVALARNRPAFLPQTLRYYHVQAKKIIDSSKKGQLTIHSAAREWLKKERQFHYGILKPGIELLKKSGIYNIALDECPAVYPAWIETSEKFSTLETEATWPEIAVLMPVWNPNPEFLKQALDSVIRQTYPKWQLGIADDASTNPEIKFILEDYKNRENRIRLTFRSQNGHICQASNSALELVDAPFTAFMDQDDLLSTHALAEVAKIFADFPCVKYAYSDDDRIDENNVRRNPVFKPDFDCDLLLTGHLSTYSTKLLREVGGLRCGTEGNQDHDLLLRATELINNPQQIKHIPHILYHWRVHENSTAGTLQAKPYVIESTKKVLLEAAKRKGLSAQIGAVEKNRIFHLLYEIPQNYSCTVILLIHKTPPSARMFSLLTGMNKRINLEIFCQPLSANSPVCRDLAKLPFSSANYFAACNAAAKKVHSDVIIFLNAELEPENICRLDQMIIFAMQNHVAMVSGNIWQGEILVNGGWYPDITGMPFPLLQGMDRTQTEIYAWGQLHMTRHVLGAPWQCMAVNGDFFRKNLFDPEFGTFATVEFGLRAMKQGKFIFMSPWVNFQSLNDPQKPDEREIDLLKTEWGEVIATNGLRNPNLQATANNDWTLKFN